MSLAESRGFRVISLGDQIEGDSREVALNHAAQFRQYIAGDPTLPLVMFSGGETTVTVRGQGRGGPNREFLLALALELDADPTIWALAGDTDGIDGSDDDAGAVISPDTLQRAALLGVDAADALETNDVGQFFSAIGDNLTTGPTRTNVNDFRVLLYQPHT
jgi:hydroxypyruvate reductase